MYCENRKLYGNTRILSARSFRFFAVYSAARPENRDRSADYRSHPPSAGISVDFSMDVRSRRSFFAKTSQLKVARIANMTVFPTNICTLFDLHRRARKIPISDENHSLYEPRAESRIFEAGYSVDKLFRDDARESS